MQILTQIRKLQSKLNGQLIKMPLNRTAASE